jgi:hypothetical protein
MVRAGSPTLGEVGVRVPEGDGQGPIVRTLLLSSAAGYMPMHHGPYPTKLILIDGVFATPEGS